MKLPTVHSPTSAPSHSSDPVRAVSTSPIGLRSSSATSGGSTWRKAIDRALRLGALAEAPTAPPRR